MEEQSAENDEDVIQPITFINGPKANDAALQKIVAARAARLNLDYMSTRKALFPNRYVSKRHYLLFMIIKNLFYVSSRHKK